ncbi:four helix bundle protein [Roseivirga sp. BDSF3-8]|uniref:four helix bundle protein n=1 Tax=Roseivirga sp. BDSF3-8 TaxID=3241598 RepID=UPI003532284A
MKGKSIVEEKAILFALQIIELYKLCKAQKEYVLSKQLLRSGTSIGANISEALAGQSRKDFLAKMSISSKEARESKYWLFLLQKSQLVTYDFTIEMEACDELIRLLTSIVKTTQSELKNGKKF